MEPESLTELSQTNISKLKPLYKFTTWLLKNVGIIIVVVGFLYGLIIFPFRLQSDISNLKRELQVTASTADVLGTQIVDQSNMFGSLELKLIQIEAKQDEIFNILEQRYK